MKPTLLAVLLAATAAQAADTKLWYDKAANDWMTETLPIGITSPDPREVQVHFNGETRTIRSERI
jgi:hypothetical protein